jgi:hypothetical protein
MCCILSVALQSSQLAEENMQLRNQVSQISPAEKQVVDTENFVTEGQSSESVMTALHSGSSQSQDNDDGSDVSLKLGLPCGAWK